MHAETLLNRTVSVCVVMTVFIGGVSLAGWVLGMLIIASITRSFIPMAPSTALAFIFLSLALLVHVGYPVQRRLRIFTAGFVLLVLLICSVILLNNVADIKIDIERLLVPDPPKLGNVSMGRMSPVTAGNFLAAAFSLLLLLILPEGKRSGKSIAVLLAMAVVLVGLWVSLSYLYGTFVFYETTIIPVALNTSAAFIILGVGIIASAGASYWPVSSLVGSSVKARLLRSFLPVTIAVVLIFGWLTTVIFMRFLDPSLIAALTAVLSIVIISFTVSRIAKVIGGEIDLADINRRKAEGALRESEERYRRITEAISDYIYTVRIENGRLVETKHSEACFAVTGYTSREFAADPGLWFKMAAEKYRSLVRKQAEDVFSGRFPQAIEHRIIRKDGVMRWVESTVVPNYDINGKLISYDGILRDVTERKDLEAQLLHAQKMETIGQLAGGIAHDFNNIMSAIVNYTYLLKKRMKEDDPSQDQIDQIFSLSMKASEITGGLLAFSRKNFLNPLPVNLNKAVLNMEKLLSKFIGEDVQLKLKLSDKDLVIMADGAQMEQVIINLATNARDAMPDGGSLTIETDLVTLNEDFIRMHGFGRPGDYALLSVADTGLGMDEQTKRRIFEPFFTTKEAGKGTGLGLAIIYGIVKQHDGYITVYSEPGTGTTFKIYFRTVTAQVPEKDETKALHFFGNAETILVAEDEAAVRNSMKSLLEKFGYSVIEAADGEEALEQFRKHKEEITLLLLDVIMPKKNGREVYEEIKKITPGIKVIYTSGYRSEIIDRKGALKDGITVISKPVFPDKLLETIRDVIHQRNEK
ncbi:MAG: response regulator [Nitrospirae bacterium]|nr:response regulator [Nitrospirota bacterium]